MLFVLFMVEFNSGIEFVTIALLCWTLYLHWSIALVGVVLLPAMAERVTRSCRTQVPAGLRFRDLVPYAITAEAVNPDTVTWRRQEVAPIVREIVIDRLGLKEGEYREEARFVEDLGMD